tara:strand:- start:19 stop:432 length:414 start_codon:yes stop_codon:yes gene_type:complete
MTTLNIENTIKAGTYFKRTTGKRGQVQGSAQLVAKFLKVEALYLELHGKRLGREAFYDMCLKLARVTKADVGGYLQYMAQDLAGIFLDKMHKEIGKEVRLNRKRKEQRTEGITISLGTHDLSTMDLARAKTGRKVAA